MATYKCTIKSPSLFIGDVCYALDDDIYQHVWGDKLKFKDGPIEDGGTVYAVATRTKYGDGEYEGNDGNMYPVDAGNIGVVGSDYYGNSENTDLGTEIEVEGGVAEVELYEEDGYITVNVNGEDIVTVNTANDDDDYDEYDPWDEEVPDEDDYEEDEE